MRDATWWSEEAIKRHKWSPNPAHLYERRRERMARGPYLEGDGHTLAIPSEPGWYRPDVAEVWKGLGFRWDGDRYAWVRDVREPLPGYRQPHRPEVWLESVRRRYCELYDSSLGRDDEDE